MSGWFHSGSSSCTARAQEQPLAGQRGRLGVHGSEHLVEPRVPLPQVLDLLVEAVEKAAHPSRVDVQETVQERVDAAHVAADVALGKGQQVVAQQPGEGSGGLSDLDSLAAADPGEGLGLAPVGHLGQALRQQVAQLVQIALADLRERRLLGEGDGVNAVADLGAEDQPEDLRQALAVVVHEGVLEKVRDAASHRPA